MILSQCCDCSEPSVRLLQPAGNKPTILEINKMKSECLEEVESLLNSQGSNRVEAGEGETALGTPPRRGDPSPPSSSRRRSQSPTIEEMERNLGINPSFKINC